MTVRISFKHKTGFLTQPVTPMTFPAGEVHLRGLDNIHHGDYSYIIIDARFSPDSLNTDVFTIRAAADSLSDAGWGSVPLYLLLPYLPGARADRGKPFGADLYGRFIADGDFTRIFILDPHSPVMPQIVQNGRPKEYVVEFPFERIIRREIQDEDSHTRPRTYDGVIAPDAGAENRATRAAKVMGVPVYLAGKTRDFETGKLTGFHMEEELPKTGRFLLVDDILDGMGTFLGLGSVIKEANPNVELDLWGTHGIFSNKENLKRAGHLFRAIHTTDSYYQNNESTPDFVHVHSVTPYLYAEVANLHGASK